jgi:hypothetical protein
MPSKSEIMYKLGKVFYILINEKGEIYGPDGYIKTFDSSDSANDYLDRVEARNFLPAPAKVMHATGVQMDSLRKAIRLRSQIERGADVRRGI